MRIFTGTKASAGVAIGTVQTIDRGTTGLHRIVSDPYRERALYEAAIVLAKDELRRLQQHAQGADADILLFQYALLEDESFTNEIGDYIAAGAGSATAVERAEQIFAGRLNNVDDAYIRERSVDVRDACRRVIDILDGRARRPLHLTKPSILAADVFFPSDLFSLDRKLILGIVSDNDSPTSHAAIVARSLGIPALLLLGEGTVAFANGKSAVLDAENGRLIVEPTHQQLTEATQLQQQWRRTMAQPSPVAAKPCRTRDDVDFALLASANISAANTITEGLESGAAGIGLVRTESLALDEMSEAQQRIQFINCIAAADGATVTLRLTNDSVLGEMHRLTMTDRRQALAQIRRDQLLAMLRAGVVGPLRVLLPGVTGPDAWDDSMRAVEECRAQLRHRGVPFEEKVTFGCSVDNPAAALMAKQIIAHGAGFLCIDTNALTRLVCGNNPESRVDDPAVLQLVGTVMAAAAEGDVPAYICGFGEQVDALPAYLKLGVRIFCTESSLMNDVKAKLIDSTTV